MTPPTRSARPPGSTRSAPRPGTEERLARLARTSFLLGAARPAHFPPDTGSEVAFAGRSNAGKSSAINALTGRRALARVSKTPGRTRQINFFEVDAGCRLVDLPGYGYARVSQAEKRLWGELVSHFLRTRDSLSGLVLIADARRVITEADLLLLDMVDAARIPVHVVLTKADKLGRRDCRDALLRARDHAAVRRAAGLQLFSATRRTRLDELAGRVCDWLPT